MACEENIKGASNMTVNNPETETGEKRRGLLVLCVNGQELQEIPLSEDQYTIGSEDDGNVDIVIRSSLVEPVHARISVTEDGHEFSCISRGGCTFINGVAFGAYALDCQHTVPLEEGDIITITMPTDEDTSPDAVTMIYHRRRDIRTNWKCMRLSGEKKFHISRNEELRGLNADEVTEEIAELSGRHATLEKDEQGWIVEDNNTKFGVYVNQRRITDKARLHPMDVIRIGDTLFLYQEGILYYNHRDVAKNCLQINIEERSVWNLFKKKVLLSDIRLTVHPGEMVLVLGGSGAGKTTFVNAVMGYEKAKGQILEGDIDIYKNYNQMKYNIAFVPQEDLLRMDDTVIGTMENAAELRMPRSVTAQERSQRINCVLETLGLEQERTSLVSKLSGGQRKRLSIGVEFVSDPTLFFLDEPDSGLDGVMARYVMEKLRDIADQNTIVMVITHQPDRVEDLFDKIIVLAKSSKDNVGHMAFFGTIEEAQEFFDTDTMEGIVKRINRVDEGGEGRADEFIEKYRALDEGRGL